MEGVAVGMKKAGDKVKGILRPAARPEVKEVNDTFADGVRPRSLCIITIMPVSCKETETP